MQLSICSGLLNCIQSSHLPCSLEFGLHLLESLSEAFLFHSQEGPTDWTVSALLGHFTFNCASDTCLHQPAAPYILVEAWTKV